jgi:hypothetical protein
MHLHLSLDFKVLISEVIAITGTLTMPFVFRQTIISKSITNLNSLQLPFLSGMGGMGEIQTLFSAEVSAPHHKNLLSSRSFTVEPRLLCILGCSHAPQAVSNKYLHVVCSTSSICHRLLSYDDQPPLPCSLHSVTDFLTLQVQLLLRSETLYFPAGSIIADSKSKAKGIMVITSGQVCFW